MTKKEVEVDKRQIEGVSVCKREREREGERERDNNTDRERNIERYSAKEI